MPLPHTRVTLAMAILGPDWGAWEVVEHDIRMAREFGLVSSSHTRRREDCVVPDGYKRMAKAGLLGPDHNLVHGTSYDAADLRTVVDNGASSFVPLSNYLIENNAIPMLQEAGREVFIHSVVTGGQGDLLEDAAGVVPAALVVGLVPDLLANLAHDVVW